MVGVADADFGIGAIALFAGELEGDDAGDVGLEGEDLQVEHELGVIGKGGGDADGAFEVGGLIVLGGAFGAFDFAFVYSVTT